jgi:SNF2 family DNA or RNA helicase
MLGDAEELEEWTDVDAGVNFTELLAKFEEQKQSSAWPYAEGVPGLQATLRPYQQQGVEWLWNHAKMGWGACLADDMGLGKTIQVISLLTLRALEGSRRPSLIVAPASLLGNWRQEFAKFSPELSVFTAHRSLASAADLQTLASGRHRVLTQPGVVLTTYGMLLRLEGLRLNAWDGAILDEAQAIKNAETSQAASARELRANFRISMTGTPVENRLEELWSQFAFLNPGYLGKAGEFSELVKRCRDGGEGLGPIRRLVKPFLLRRLKSDPTVAPDLPKKTEMNAWCSLGKRQAMLYQRAIKGLKEQLAAAKDDPQARQAAVLGILLKLKQICNHPTLFSGDGAWESNESGKFRRLRELAEEIHANGEKVLIFTQFREMTEPLARELARVFQRPGLILHGGTPVARRQELVKEFQRPEGPSFFVISLKAGGTGLNLTAASQVIHFDRWWNPAVEDQATDRAYRIGQLERVLVHKFVCQGTLEERIDTIISQKKELADEILGTDGGAEQLLLKLDDENLTAFLEFRGTDEESDT